MTYLTWLISMTLEIPVDFWPVSLSLLCFTLIGVVFWLRGEPRPRFSVWVIAGCLCYTGAILLYGMTRAAGPGGAAKLHAEAAPYVVYGLLLVQLTTSTALLVFAKPRQRILLSAALLCEFWLSLSAGFVALMSVSGDWL